MTENGGVVEVSDTTWEGEIERGTLPAVVMFYSETCPFCKQIEPFFRQFAGEFGEKLLFARLNVSENPWTIERYAVRQTPTFKFFCTGNRCRKSSERRFLHFSREISRSFSSTGKGAPGAAPRSITRSPGMDRRKTDG
jgi:thiol-disulfide isomerase/thioredoxin